MAASVLRPSRRRWKKVRLIDVPRNVRMEGARMVIRDEPGLTEDDVLALVMLALNPPETLVAWIAP